MTDSHGFGDVTGEQISTVVMIKPDGVGRAEVASAVICGLVDRSLTVSRSEELRLTRSDVAALFPAFRGCPITLSLLAAYLTNGPVRMLVLTGAHVIDGALSVRKEVRRRFARSSFENCLHVAADETEAALQLRWLATRQGWPLPRVPDDPSRTLKSIPGVAGTMARLGEPALRALGVKVWHRANEIGWEGHWRVPPCAGEWTVIVNSEQENSIDSAASYLLDVVPGLTAESAVYAALEIDRAGSAPVFRGTREESCAVSDGLSQRGLTVRLARTPVPMANSHTGGAVDG